MSAADAHARRVDSYDAVPQDANSTARLPHVPGYGDEEDVAGADDASADEPLPPPTASTRRIMLMLGAAILLPWNAMITASGYFASRLADSPHASRFSYTLSSTLTVANLLCLLHSTLTSKRLPVTRRLRMSGLLITGLFALLAVTTIVRGIPPTPFFWLVLIAGAIQSGAGSYMNTAVFALSSLFGPLTLQAAMAGQAAAGVLVSIVQFITTYSAQRQGTGVNGAMTAQDEADEADANATAAFWFFAFSTAFMLASLLGHAYVARQRTFGRVVEPFEEIQVALKETATTGIGKDELKQIGRVAKANAIYNGTVAFVFAVTLVRVCSCVFRLTVGLPTFVRLSPQSVYPAITGSVTPASPANDRSLRNPALFTALHFIAFNVGDWSGRYACSYERLQIHNPRTILLLAVTRLLFIPIFLSCNVTGSGGAPDALFLLSVLALGITGGWLGSLCMMGAADPVHNHRLKAREDVDTAATIASFCLVGGLTLGSFASFGVSSLIK